MKKYVGNMKKYVESSKTWKNYTTWNLEIYWLSQTIKIMFHVFTLHLASPTGCIRMKKKLGIFPSSRAYIEKERSEFFQAPEPKRKFGLGKEYEEI